MSDMKNPTISLVNENENQRNTNDDMVKRLQKEAEDAIKRSKQNRRDFYQFDGHLLDSAIERMKVANIPDEESCLNLLIEKYQCENMIFPMPDRTVRLLGFSYPSFEDVVRSSTYISIDWLLCKFPNVRKNIKFLMDRVKDYYDARERLRMNSVVYDLVILTDDLSAVWAEHLCNKLSSYRIYKMNLDRFDAKKDTETLYAISQCKMLISFGNEASRSKLELEWKRLALSQNTECELLLIKNSASGANLQIADFKPFELDFSDSKWTQNAIALIQKTVEVVEDTSTVSSPIVSKPNVQPKATRQVSPVQPERPMKEAPQKQPIANKQSLQKTPSQGKKSQKAKSYMDRASRYLLNATEENLQKAFDCYTKAADLDDPMAMIELSSWYSGYGYGKRDLEKCLMWYYKSKEIAFEYGTADVQNAIGDELSVFSLLPICNSVFNKHEYVLWYRKAADQGYAKAQYNLADCYHNGLGVEKSNEDAIKWYRMAADQGNADAQYMLATSYSHGWGGRKNEEEAVKWYRMAAEQGHTEAQKILGDCYLHGWGVEQNDEEARKWRQKAAD